MDKVFAAGIVGSVVGLWIAAGISKSRTMRAIAFAVFPGGIFVPGAYVAIHGMLKDYSQSLAIVVAIPIAILPALLFGWIGYRFLKSPDAVEEPESNSDVESVGILQKIANFDVSNLYWIGGLILIGLAIAYVVLVE